MTKPLTVAWSTPFEARAALPLAERMAATNAALGDLSRRIAALQARHPQRLRRAHVMVDLETLGTAPGSIPRSLGAVAHDPVTGAMGEQFYRNIDQASCEALGLVSDPDTLAWWARQSPQAQAALEIDPRPVREVLADFDLFWRRVGGVEFWANGANFDDPILAAVYRAAGRKPPWKFWNARDTRTIYTAAGVKPDRAAGVHHNALTDALTQAVALIAGFRVLGLNRPLSLSQRLAIAWRALMGSRQAMRS